MMEQPYNLCIERLKTAVAVSVEGSNHGPAGYRGNDGDFLQHIPICKARRQPKWNAMALDPPPDKASAIMFSTGGTWSR